MAEQEAAVAAEETTAPDPSDFPAWEAAELAEKSGEPSTPAVEAGTPKTSEPTGEPKGEPGKVEAQPDPEAGKDKEQEKELEKEHGPGWYRRLDRKRKLEIRETREQIASLQEQLAAKSTPAPAAVIPAAEATVEPKEDDYETTAEFTRALTVFHAEQIADRKVAAFRKDVATQLEADAQKAQRQSREDIQSKQNQKWANDVAEAKKNHPDFDEVVFSDTNIPSFMDRYTRLGSEHSGELAYYLGSKPDEVSRIAALPQVQQIREFVKIEAQFSVKEEPAPKPKTQETTPQKPKPPTPIGSGNSAAVIPNIDDPAIVGHFPTWERLERERLGSK